MYGKGIFGFVHGGVFAITCTAVVAAVAEFLDGSAAAGAVLARFERMCIFLRSAAKRLRMLWTTGKNQDG